MNNDFSHLPRQCQMKTKMEASSRHNAKRVFVCVCARQIMELLMKGNKQRTQEPTAANQTSSRPHAVLQVAVRQQSRSPDVLQEVRFARLFMIDLAGSERASQVTARGGRGGELGALVFQGVFAVGWTHVWG